MLTYCVLDIECSKIPHHCPWHEGAFLSSVGIERMDGTSTVWFFNPNDRPHEELIEEIQKELDSVDYLVGHNIKFDINWLKWTGFNVGDKKLWCTQIAEYLLNGQRKVEYSLNASCERYGLGRKLDAMKMYWDAGYETDEIPLNIHELYLKQDVHLTHELFKKQVPLIKEYGLSEIADISFQISQVLSDVEVSGVKFNKDEALKYVAEEQEKFEELDKKLVELAGIEFNPKSPAQLKAVMFGGTWNVDGRETYTVTLKDGTVKERSRKCKVPVTFEGLGFDSSVAINHKTGNLSTGKNTLDLLVGHDEKAKQFLDILKTQRKLSKVLSSLLGTKDDTGLINVVGVDTRIHPSFNQTVTHTGRLSSSNPNGQNLPRSGTSPVKKLFESCQGYIVNLDLGQIEWRMAAELSRDPVMLHELYTNLDIHADNAKKFFGADKYPEDSAEFKALRTTAKVFGFRLLYGGGPYAFYKDQRMPHFSLKKWESIVKAFYAKYQGLKAWQERNIATVTAQGFLRNPSGRLLSFDKLMNREGYEEWDTKQIYNFPVQSSSSDIMYVLMIEFAKWLKQNKMKTKLVLQVHDSMVLDCPKEEVETVVREGVKFFSRISQFAKTYFNWDTVVPFVGDAEVGYTYGTTKAVKEKDFDIVFQDLDKYLTEK